MSAKLSTNQMQIETRRYSRFQTLEAYYITISIIRLFRLRYFDFKKNKGELLLYNFFVVVARALIYRVLHK